MERINKHRSQARILSGPGRDSGGGSALRDFPRAPERNALRPNTAPAYYLGHPARLWITVMRPRRRASASHHPVQAVTGGGYTPARQGGPVTGAGTETACATRTTAPLSASWPTIWELAWAARDQWPSGGQ